MNTLKLTGQQSETAERGSGLRHFIVALIIAMSVTYSIAYTSIQYFNSNNVGGMNDAVGYMQLVEEGLQIKTRRSKNSRVFTVLIVRAIPDPPRWIFSRTRTVDQEWLIRIKFAAINSILVVGTAMLVWYNLRILAFSPLESYLGMLFFLGSLFVVYASTIPMVEASNFFFIALGTMAILRANMVLFGAALLVGLFAKETVGIIIPLALVSVPRRWRSWLIWAVPGLGAYLAFRAWSLSQGTGDLGEFEPDELLSVIGSFKYLIRFNVAAELVGAFGLLWVPALYALFTGRLPNMLRRQSIILGLLLIIALALGVSVGRTIFMAFPVIIPAALFGIRAFLRVESTSPHPAAE